MCVVLLLATQFIVAIQGFFKLEFQFPLTPRPLFTADLDELNQYIQNA